LESAKKLGFAKMGGKIGLGFIPRLNGKFFKSRNFGANKIGFLGFG